MHSDPGAVYHAVEGCDRFKPLSAVILKGYNPNRVFDRNYRTGSMAKTTPELKRIIKRYRLQLKKQGIHPIRVLLYGSQAAGTAQEGSDVDLIVISNDWKKYSHRERLELLGIAAARILEPVQAQGFTPAEIQGNQVMPFWEQVIKEQSVVV